MIAFCWHLEGTREASAGRIACHATVVAPTSVDALAVLLEVWPTFWPWRDPVEVHNIDEHLLPGVRRYRRRSAAPD